MTLSLNDHINSLLSIPTSTVGNTERADNKGVLSLFTIAGITRNMAYRYATINAAGNINFHVMSPFCFIDDNQSDAQYRKKTVYASINTDPNQDKNDPHKFYNNNLGNYLVLMRKVIEVNGKNSPNPYNKLTLHSTQIKQGLIPSSIDNINLAALNTPLKDLQEYVNMIKADEDIEPKEKSKLFIEAYEDYKNKLLEFVEQGLLTYSFFFINPKANSINFDLGIEESMLAHSSPWMNIKALTSLGIPLSDFPVLNDYKATVQIIDTDDLNILHSDNLNMLGKRTIYTNQETGKAREALSKVAIIKDYNSDTPILISITDTANINTNNRGRVEAFEDLLDKGINTFTIEGSLSPVVREVDSNAGRNGNIFFQLVVDKYDVYQSSTTRNTIEADAFADIGMEDVEFDTEVLGSLVMDTVTPIDSNTNSTDTDSVLNALGNGDSELQ